MDVRELIKKILNDFFLITTGILIGIIAYSRIFEPDATFHIDELQTIIISAGVTSLPTLIFYSKKELNKKQMIIRQVIHFILLESIILWSAYKNNGIENGNFAQAFSIFGIVFVIYLTVRIKSWVFDKKEATRLNERLKKYKEEVNS